MTKRYVRTEAGAKFYGLPIGSLITEDGESQEEGREITFARLLSIRQMADAAKRVGDDTATKYYADLLQSEYYRVSPNPALRSAVAEVINSLAGGNGDYQELVDKAPRRRDGE